MGLVRYWDVKNDEKYQGSIESIQKCICDQSTRFSNQKNRSRNQEVAFKRNFLKRTTYSILFVSGWSFIPSQGHGLELAE